MALIYEKGRAKLKINMIDYDVVAPCVMIIVRDSMFHVLDVSDNIEAKAIVMSPDFSNSLFNNFYEIYPIYDSLIKTPVFKIDGENNVFNQYYDLLLNIARSPQMHYKLEVARHLTLAMFYGYSHEKHGFYNNDNKSSRQESLYSEFISLLSKNYKKEREVAFYAAKLCVTPKYLSQMMKDLTSKTAIKYIQDFVVLEAKSLMLSTSMSIQQISDALSFPSQSSFTKYFKRVTGKSPKEYKQFIK